MLDVGYEYWEVRYKRCVLGEPVMLNAAKHLIN